MIILFTAFMKSVRSIILFDISRKFQNFPDVQVFQMSDFTAKHIIQQSGLHKKYWPKRYIMPNRKIRRLYCLKKREIPKWCYYQLLLSFVYIVLFVISFLLYLLLVNKPFVAQLLMWIYCIVIALDLLYIMVCSFIYKK